MLTVDSKEINSAAKVKDVFKKYIYNTAFNAYLYELCKTVEEFTILSLKMMFNNEKSPRTKSMFYNKELGNFYGIFKHLSDKNKKEVRQIEYDKHIDPIFRPIVLELYRILEDSFDEVNKSPSASDDSYHKFLDITQNRMESLNQLKNMAKDILYENNIISKEEHDKLSNDYNTFCQKSKT